jgi:hypothetical protein
MKVYCETCDKDVEPEFGDSIVDQSTDPDCVMLDIEGWCPECCDGLVGGLLKLNLKTNEVTPIEPLTFP